GARPHRRRRDPAGQPRPVPALRPRRRSEAPRQRRGAPRRRQAPRVQPRPRHPGRHATRARGGARRARARDRPETTIDLSEAAPAPIAVVLMNMGGPDSLEAVEPFLYNLFRDHDLIPLPLGFLWQRRFARMVSRARARTVREYYKLIGGRSPIGDITAEQAAKLQARLGARFSCHLAMRYTPPFTRDAIAEVRNAGARTVVGLSLYPHFTTATTGSSLWELRRELAGKSPAAGAIDLLEIDRWPDHPAYLDALTTQVQRGL